MDIPLEIWIVGGIGALGVLVILVGFMMQRRKVDLTGPDAPGEKPQWMHELPPSETVAATQADGEGIALYDHDAGEQMASPFAEQIEDVVRARIDQDPDLAGMSIDLGTGPDGGLEIWVDGVNYTNFDEIPNAHLQEVIRQAIESWNQRQM